ncbi:STE3-type pheromone receptor [Ceratobasidium sp. AG-Ba]|nr:STE3-type pheromone receptor [Ceratobasidium sp. AG-Ba]
MVNSIIWAGNTDDIAPIWCDISSRLIVGLSVGIPASSLCIQRRLYHIAKGHTNESPQGFQSLCFDLSLGIGFPAVIMAAYYIIQVRRYAILEDIGCWTAIYPSLVVIPVIQIWPVLLGVVSFIYAAHTIKLLIGSRRQFSAVLSGKNAPLTTHRYFRLMALALTEMAFCIPLGLFIIIEGNRHSNLREPWVSWAYAHEYIQLIYPVPAEAIRARNRGILDLTRWLVPGCAFLFFMFFGFSGESVADYKSFTRSCLCVLGVMSKEPERKPDHQAQNPVNGDPSSTPTETYTQDVESQI